MKKPLLILLLLLLFIPSLAQEQYRWFHHIRATSDDVLSFCPDESGRLWIGTTRGLFRYGDNPDGVRYDLLPEELQHGVIEIYPLERGMLLVRTRDGLLWIYDAAENDVRAFAQCVSEWGFDSSADWTLKIRRTSDGALWLYRRGQLYRKAPGENVIRAISEFPGVIRNLDFHDGEYCVVTDSLLYVSSLEHPESIRSFPHGIEFHRSGVWCAFDGERNVWIGSEGLYRFPGGNGSKECILDNVPVMDMMMSRTGDILLATGISGIYVFGPDGSVSQHATHQAFESGSLGSDNVRSIREGPDGALWVSYGKPSVSVSLPGSMASPSRHILPLLGSGVEENVSSIAQAPDGTVWFGTDGHGLFCRSADSGEFTAPRFSFSQPSVTAIFFDSRERTWIGTYMGGVYCKDRGKVYHFLPTASGFCFLEDSRGDIWVGMQGQGVYRIAAGLDKEPVRIDMKGNNWVYGLSETGGTIYAITTNGLFAVDAVTEESVRVSGAGSQDFRNEFFWAQAADSRGLLWLAGGRSDTPLEIFDQARNTILYIPQLEGRIIKSIIEDADRNVWLATEKDLVQVIVNYDTSRQQFTFHPSVYRFHSQEPIESFNNARSAARLSDGTLLFGGTAGYLQVNPADFPPHATIPSAPVLSVTTVIVNDEYIWGTDLSSSSSLKLPHNRNDITLVISSQDYSSPFETGILYRLKGSDYAWKQVHGNIINLDRLSPGHYDVEIGNGYPDGSIAGTVINYTIEIGRPWYGTWWAWLLYVLTAGTAVGLLAYYYIDRQRKKISLEQIRQEADRQHRLNEMKLRFFTNVSHDFRTPLSMIITPLETYLNDPSHKADESFFRPIYRNAVRLLNLVNQILDFRKLEADSARLNLTYGDIVPFLEDICSSFTLFADEKAIRIEFLPSEDSVLTSFDKDKLSKTVMNLLSNAFKFTPSGGIVRVGVSSSDKEALITVSDTGPGIPDGQKDAVFKRFYQYNGDDAPYIGTGIGLHIVKEFTELHGGSVSVGDNVPSGSVFTVRIPLREKAEADIPEMADNIVPASDVAPSAGGNRILLVEDNADFRNFVSSELSRHYAVFTAADGNSALDVLEKEDIDLIVSDIMMEGMDGLELCKRVKTNLDTSHIPFIMLTAKAMAEDEIHGLELGADDYVTKPFHMQILMLRIQKQLEARSQARREFREKLDVAPSEITITSLDEQFLAKAIGLVEENMSDSDFSVERLSSLVNMHRTNLYKKLLSLTGRTPQEFIRTIRLKRAAQYLLRSQLYVSEIAYRVGFNSPKLFSRHFREAFGMTPKEYQRSNGVETIHEGDDR